MVPVRGDGSALVQLEEGRAERAGDEDDKDQT